jgi:hypothetical protein
MTHIDDDTLAAFADGELDADRAAAIRLQLAGDAALRERLQRLKNLDDLLKASVAADVDMPERFANLLKPAAEVVPLPAKRRLGWMPIAGTAIAAGLAMVMFGVSLTASQVGWLRHVDDGVAISGAVEMAAISAPSGSLVKAGDLNIRPVVSFLANDGRECREIHVRDKELAARFVACRDIHHDEWCIEAFATMPLDQFPETYRTAGVTKDPVIDAALERLGIRQTLDEKAENAAIARKWHPR